MDFLQAVRQLMAQQAKKQQAASPAPARAPDGAPAAGPWFLHKLRMLASGPSELEGLGKEEEDEEDEEVAERNPRTLRYEHDGVTGRSLSHEGGHNDEEGHYHELTSTSDTELGDYYQDKRSTTARVGTGGVRVEESSSSKERDTQGNETRQTSKEGGGINTGGASWSSSSETEIENEETGAKLTEGSESSIGVKHGKLEAKLGTSESHFDGTQGSGKASSVAIDGMNIAGQSSETRTQKRDDGATDESSTTTDVKLGKDGITGGRGWKKKTTNEDGSSDETTGGVQGDVGEGKYGGQIGTAKRNADGEIESSAQAHGGVDLGADGLQGVELGVTLQKGPVKLSIDGGARAAAEVQPLGDGYLVTWERTEQAGAGGGASVGPVGLEASGKAAHIERGARVFATQEEAEKFRSRAADLLSDVGREPSTADAALEMSIGEARGAVDMLGGDVAGKLEAGVASFDAGAGKTSQDGYVVERVDETVFTVMAMSTDAEDVHGGMHAGGYGAGGSSSSSQGHSVKLRFDLGTSEGRAAYDEFLRTRRVPDEGADVLQAVDTRGAEDAIDIDAGIGTARSYETVSETHVRDEQGTHETYQGAKGRDVSVDDIPIVSDLLGGSGEEHERFGIESRQENDRDAGHLLSVDLDTRDGGKAYEDLAWTTGAYVDPAHKETLGESSGKWRLEVEMAPEEMERVLDLAASGKLVKKDWSGNHEELEALGREVRMARRIAKATGAPLDLDGQMRLLSKYVAEGGPEALRTLEQFSGKSWNVSLEGDDNFAGAEGHRATGTRIERYEARIEAAEASPALRVLLVEQLMHEQVTLAERRAALADPDRYRDLPPNLREAELDRIDLELGRMAALQNQAITSDAGNVALGEQARRRATGLDSTVAERQASIEESLVVARTYHEGNAEDDAYAAQMAAHAGVMAQIAAAADGRIAELRAQMAKAPPSERDRLAAELEVALDARLAQLEAAEGAANEATLAATGLQHQGRR